MRKLIFTSLVLILIAAQTAIGQTYTITTIVDTTNTVGFTGDNGQAKAAEVDNPIHSAPDKLGNLYIADNVNHRIRKIDVNGVITTIAGTGVVGNNGNGGQATAAELNTPVALAIDDSGNIYICDRAACVVRKIYTNGIITTVAGNGSAGFTGDGGPATKAQLGEPRGVALDDSGNIYIADFGNSCIRKVEKKSDTITTIAGMGYVFGYTGDGGPATAAKLNYAAQLALDDSGDIYIDDYGNNVIRKVNNKGIISTFAGNGTPGYYGDDVPATSAELDQPLGVAVNKAGDVFITDYTSQRVRKVDTSGIITTIAGTGVQGHTGDYGPALSAEMYSAAGINLDTLGNLYISELASPGNDDIRKLTPSCDIALTYNPSQTLCYGQSIALLVSGGTTYTWSPATGLNVTTGDSVIASPTANVTYMVTASDTAGCTVTKAIAVSLIPSPNKPTFTQHNDTLVSSSTYDNQWYRNDTMLTNDTSQVLIITILGEYWVSVNNEANGCSTNSDSMNISSLTGVNQLSAISKLLSVYPNPNNGQMTVSLGGDYLSIKIFDELGREIYTQPLDASQQNKNLTVNISSYPDGIYFLQVNTAKKIIGTEIAKER